MLWWLVMWPWCHILSAVIGSCFDWLVWISIETDHALRGFNDFMYPWEQRPWYKHRKIWSFTCPGMSIVENHLYSSMKRSPGLDDLSTLLVCCSEIFHTTMILYIGNLLQLMDDVHQAYSAIIFCWLMKTCLPFQCSKWYNKV